MNDYFVYTPEVTRNFIPLPNSFDKTEENVKNKYLRKFFDKIHSYMVKKGYLKEKSYYETSYNVTTHRIDMDRLDEEICRNNQAIAAVYDKRVDTIIVGADVMRRIMRNSDPMKVGMITTQLHGESRYAAFQGGYPGAEFRQRLQYTGLTVIMVPWFKGFLLLPKGEMGYERY